MKGESPTQKQNPMAMPPVFIPYMFIYNSIKNEMQTFSSEEPKLFKLGFAYIYLRIDLLVSFIGFEDF